MPSTLNGIGTGYWGRRNAVTLEGHCDHCQKVTPHNSYDTYYCFVVLFIPVIPLGRKRIMDECDVCKRHHVMPLKKYEQFKLQSIQEATANYRAEPGHLPTIRAFIETLISFRDESLFNQAAVEMERLNQSNGDVLELLGDGFGVFKNLAASEHCYKTALYLEDTDTRRFKLVYNLIDQRRATEALPFVVPLFQEQRDGQMHLLYSLFFCFQAEGLHEQALDYLERLMVAFPALASDKILAKARAKSLKHRASGKKIVTKDWIKYSQTESRRTKFRFRLIVAAVVVVLYLFASVLAGYHTIYVLNGTNTDYEVRIGKHTINLGANSHITMTVPEGDTDVVYTKPNGQKVEESFTLDTLFLMRVFDHEAYVLNPDRTALVLHETAYYSSSKYNTREGTQHLSRPVFFRNYEDVSYAFKEFPESIMIKGNETVSKTRISQLEPQSTAEAVNYLLAAGSMEATLGYLTQAIHFDASNTMAYLYYAELERPEKAKLMIEPRLNLLPLNLPLHCAYQDLFSYLDETLQDRYRTMLAADPLNSDLLYLNGRIDVFSGESQVDLKRAVNSTPTHLSALSDLIFRQLCNGQITQGLAVTLDVLSQDPTQDDFIQRHIDFLDAGQHYEAAIKQAREMLDRYPGYLDLAGRIYLWQILLGHKILESDVKALIPEGLDPVTEKEWRLSFQTLAQYNNGNLKSITSAKMVEDYQNAIRLAEPLTEASLDYKGDANYLVGLIIRARHQAKAELADKAQALLVAEYQQMPTYYPALAEILSGKEPERILTLAIEPELKRGILVAVGQQYPQWRKECFSLAQTLNYRRSFPYLIVKEALEGTTN